ncbi:hypothetical protein L486_07394 [Kwoniella mangroviensis CBS 10435]|uniref:Lipid droplet-associated perilipin protein n=1 Tax=Kwoniella mangroviensis CBS 10435 TaxID=1331196 RepID=A0A1B9IIP8_9TREE|nr:hypothetical protein L486_07394 [Kwoniella mangroviensis CBS 10435]OCF71992.1 hypothetical protein I204_07256 [Kwoniella mangroviensis CBS 8886]
MATTASAPASAPTTTEVPNFKIVGKLDGVPVVHDSVTYAQQVLQSNEYTAKLYATALALANKSYQVATPVLVRTKPILESADGLAVATFDRAEATFPYPFKTPTQDLVVVKQAKGIYDGQIHPYIASAQPVLTDILDKTSQINSAISSRAVATVHTSQDLAHSLLEQLRHLAEHGQNLPATLINGVGKVTGDLKEIVFAKDATIQDKSNKLAAYVKDHAKPVIEEIYNYVNAAKLKAEQEAQAVGEAANGTVENVSAPQS